MVLSKCWRFVIAIVTVTIAQVASSPRATMQEVSRVIRQNNDPIPSRILGTDQTVLVTSRNPPGLAVVADPHASVSDAVLMATSDADAIFLADVTRTEARLVDRDTWLATYTSVHVVDVVKSSAAHRVSAGDVLEMAQDGGVAMIKGVKVIADKDTMQRREFEQGKRYLLFVSFYPDSGMAIPLVSLQVLDGGALASMIVREPGSDWRQVLSGLTVDQLVSQVRRAKATLR